MIFTRLIGGLGNQMFQYAAGKSLANANACRLKLDISGFGNYKLHNGYELNHFNIDADIALEEEIRKLVNGESRLARYIYKKLRIWKNTHYLEQGFAFDPRITEIKHSVYLDGYWQSYRYFESIEQELKHEFTPKKPLSGLNIKIAEQIADVNSVSIHIRRGDYVNSQTTSKVHGFLGVNFYKESIGIICSRLPNPYFFVFSDDIVWARENLGLTNNVTFVDHNQGVDSYEDMRLMSLCRHHIIANSSFSWWGAWLGHNARKIVLYPDRWFTTNERDTSTLCPPSWESVKV